MAQVLKYVVFIDTGLVEVLVRGEHVAEMGDGSYLGEIYPPTQCTVSHTDHRAVLPQTGSSELRTPCNRVWHRRDLGARPPER